MCYICGSLIILKYNGRKGRGVNVGLIQDIRGACYIITGHMGCVVGGKFHPELTYSSPALSRTSACLMKYLYTIWNDK